jgi:glycosyltransferase involved in cell wall biosynthesis
MHKVAIIYKSIPLYRRDFFNGLRNSLRKKDIDLILIYGQPGRKDALKKDATDLDWALKVQSKIFEIGRYEVYWQPALPYLKNIDLVIVEQASKLLLNYVLLLQNALGIRKVAFWGHGKNFQEGSANQFAEWVKRWVSKRVHWWFAYNEVSANIVRNLGFPTKRITLVQNAVDTRFLTKALKNLSVEQINHTRTELNIHSQHVGIYTGGMYPEKRLFFLLEAIQHVRTKINDFEMIFIGSGIDAPIIKNAAVKFNWIHFIGPKFDLEKIPYFAISQVFLMPSAIGLGILDTFALETPLITMEGSLHGPEIDYLKNGLNGIMLPRSSQPRDYANAIVHFLTHQKERDTILNGCRASQKIYTIENMIERFSDGVVNALK